MRAEKSYLLIKSRKGAITRIKKYRQLQRQRRYWMAHGAAMTDQGQQTGERYIRILEAKIGYLQLQFGIESKEVQGDEYS